MLVLSRRLMERIQIGDSVFVSVLEIRGKRVRIGIDAPQEVRVRRAELETRDFELPGRLAPAAVVPSEASPPVLR